WKPDADDVPDDHAESQNQSGPNAHAPEDGSELALRPHSETSIPSFRQSPSGGESPGFWQPQPADSREDPRSTRGRRSMPASVVFLLNNGCGRGFPSPFTYLRFG